jgi:hypothetical protein
MSEETPGQVTLDDLLPIEWIDPREHGESITGFQMCTRCSGVVYSDDRGEALAAHERWHAAIEDLTVTGTFTVIDPITKVPSFDAWTPRPITVGRINPEGGPTCDLFEWVMTEGDEPESVKGSNMLRIPFSPEQRRELVVALGLDPNRAADCTWPAIMDRVRRSAAAPTQTDQPHPEVEACRVALVTALEHPAEDTTFEQAVELVETLIDDRKYCRKHHADFSQGETNRLRRIEDALVAVGAPNRSERGDPGGLVVRWIERQVQRMAELQEENKAAGRAIKALADRVPTGVYAEAVKRVTELEKQLAARSNTVTTMDMRLDLPDGWQDKIRNCYTAGGVIDMVRGWATHVCEANCTRDHPEGDISDQALSDLLLLVGVTVTPEQLAAWTPEQREQAAEWAGLVHLDASDNDVDVPERPAFLDRPAEAEQVCPSLYLQGEKLLACTLPIGEHDKSLYWHGDNDPVTRMVWGSSKAVPSPWPVDREPPAGINLLRDTGVPPGEEMPYLLRAEGWRWSQNQDGTDVVSLPGSWAEVTIGVSGDLVVVRP